MREKLNKNIVFEALKKEEQRQLEHVELIASENYVSDDVLAMQGSVLTNKYAEGYPNKRYYGGCEYVDIIEQQAIDALNALFGSKYSNVQPHSGSQANMGVYLALLNPGDTILGMSLTSGGHLTHGFHLSFSGELYNAKFYEVDKDTELIDYEDVRAKALEFKPKLIIAGASAYARLIDFKRFREIADEVGAYLMVDMAHIAGMVAAGLHPSPIPYAHVVTSTTHKTLRGPRGGIILTNDAEIAKKIDRAVFPGVQGGPLMHVIGAKAIAFNEALDDSFKEYQLQVIKNAKKLAESMKAKGYRIVSETTDNHLVLIDVKNTLDITGKIAEDTLGKVNITINKNTIPFDKLKAHHASGIRLGTPALTTRGLKEAEMEILAGFIDEALRNYTDENKLFEIKENVRKMMVKYPLFKK